MENQVALFILHFNFQMWITFEYCPQYSKYDFEKLNVKRLFRFHFSTVFNFNMSIQYVNIMQIVLLHFHFHFYSNNTYIQYYNAIMELHFHFQVYMIMSPIGFHTARSEILTYNLQYYRNDVPSVPTITSWEIEIIIHWSFTSKASYWLFKFKLRLNIMCIKD